jgi:hypothetical protein
MLYGVNSRHDGGVVFADPYVMQQSRGDEGGWCSARTSALVRQAISGQDQALGRAGDFLALSIA